MFLSNVIQKKRSRMLSHSFIQVHGRRNSFYSRNSEVMPAVPYMRMTKRNFNQESKCTKSRWIELIREFTVISRNHMTPEIRLHLITPASHLWSACESESSPFCDPFWAFYWPGGQALSRYILDNAWIVKGKTVLDFGCGSGACAIAAAMSEAKSVTANDIDEVACIAAELNADLNNVGVKICSSNFIGQLIPWDCILVGDMFYNEEFASLLFNWLRLLHNSGKLILIGDAGRLALKNICEREKLKSLATVDLPSHVQAENNGLTMAEIWSL